MSTSAVATVTISKDSRDRMLRAFVEMAESVKAYLEDEQRLAKDPDADVILSLAEASAELREPETTVRAKCQRGEIRAEKRGRLWKVTRAELARYRARCVRRGRFRAVEGKTEA